MAERTYKYRIYPNKEQMTKIRMNCGHVRFVYNQLLSERTKAYRATGKWKKLDLEKIIQENPFLKYADPSALNFAKISLMEAYQRFFYTERHLPDRYRPEALERSHKDPEYRLMRCDLMCYPRFKKKKHAAEGYSTELTEVKIENGRIMIPALGAMKIKYHRPVPQDSIIAKCIVRKLPSGQYYLLLQLEIETPEIRYVDEPLSVLFDEHGHILRSDGVKMQEMPFDKDLQKQIRKAHQTLKRRVPGSKRYEAQYKHFSALVEKQVNQRQDWLHKTSLSIAKTAELVCVTKPYVQKRLAALDTPKKRRKLLEQSRYTLYAYIKYKSEQDGKRFMDFSKQFPVPMFEMCSKCSVVAKSAVPGRWKCPKCGVQMSHPQNALNNMQKFSAQNTREWKEALQKH